ncbi:MAG TPA: phage terminase large subunit family protein [Candidatus Acidoferrales bacterium]|jgi:hypothetical protein|nr:phage terminase large subunit family protein [Candidatus Acidoferrales bacterium]
MKRQAKTRYKQLTDPIIKKRPRVNVPKRASFEDFLLADARVPNGQGLYGPYSFAGREALREVVQVIDDILKHKRADAEVALAGGAQFGKTILELNLAAYVTGQQFRNFGLYLPDDDLVEGIVDAKFRPDVVDQIGWFAEMVQVGKALNKSGRAVNRKGAFLVTDGQRKAVGMIRGLGKVPTTFSMDVGAMDELDDIQPKMMKFVRGRLTASDLRFVFKTGTQRVHGRGMNKAWKDGSQGVFILTCPECRRRHCPEEEFPQIVRLDLGSGVSGLGRAKLQASNIQAPEKHQTSISKHKRADAVVGAPKLTWAGDFKVDGDDLSSFAHEPSNEYFLGCVECGAELNRSLPIVEHRRQEQLAQRKWSFRISQLGIGAIDLSQIVTRFQAAVADPEEMIVFRCDVLGLPQSTAQALTPAIMDRARAVESFSLGVRGRENGKAYGGLDMGDRCWMFVRAHVGDQKGDGQRVGNRPGNLDWMGFPRVEGSTPDELNPLYQRAVQDGLIRNQQHQHAGSEVRAGLAGGPARLLAAEGISAGDVVGRAQALFHSLGLSALFIDERPLVNEARSLALALNGLQHLTVWPRIANVNTDYISLPGGLTWDGRNSRWLNLKCAVVRFTKNKLGAGIEQSVVFFEEGGQTKFVPCIACNRFETIDRVVREFLTPAEGVVEVVNGAVRETPALLLPPRVAGQPPILDLVDAHHITGSERAKAADGSLGDYVDGCENHLLLANGYAKLAEVVCGSRVEHGPGPIRVFENTRRSRIILAKQNRCCE